MGKDVNFENHNPTNPSNLRSLRCGEIVWNIKENFQIYCFQCTDTEQGTKHFTNVLEFIKHTANEHLKLDYKSFDEFLGNEIAPESIDLKLKMESFDEDLTSSYMLFDNFDSTLEKKEDELNTNTSNTNIIEKCFQTANNQDKSNNVKNLLSKDKVMNKDQNTEIQSDTKIKKLPKGKKFLKTNQSATRLKVDNESCVKLKASGTPSSRPERMPCEICGKVFNKYRMSSHLRSHDPDRFAFKCNACEKLFVNQKNLDFHVKSFHLNDGRKFVCNISGCTKNFANQIALRNHAKTHTNTEDRPFKCDCCHRRFLYDSDKRKHMRIMHINGKTFACDKCDRTYYLEYDLNRHKVVHNEIKPWPCDECQATFISRHTLARHKKCHSNIKEYVCNICKKEFPIYEYLYAHMKTHGISSWNAKVYKKNLEAPAEILLDKAEKST